MDLVSGGYRAKVIADSISVDGVRLLSLECTYPRFIHSEMMTHRMFCRNSASSRAIPYYKMIKKESGEVVPDPKSLREQIRNNPVIPLYFGKEQKGMQSGDHLQGGELLDAIRHWLAARDQALIRADCLADLGVHKSLCNRIVEPWMWITVLITATDWKNFFKLRCHPDAEKHMQKIAYMMRQCYDEHKPTSLDNGFWHLPYISDSDYFEVKSHEIMKLVKVSTGRCARLSYLTHDGVRSMSKDVDLHDKLVIDGHWSPFEHPAIPANPHQYYGPLRGWQSYRKFFDNERVKEND